MKKITLYTRVYNTEKYLPRCLESVINQTFKDFKHIIIDNGCTDGCTDILKEYAAKYSWVKLIRYEKNRSGIDISDYIDTPYFCQLDSDDWLERDFFEKMLAIIEKEQADIVSTGNYFHDGNGNILGVRDVRNKLTMSTNEDFSDYYRFYHQFYRTTWGKLYRTDVYKKGLAELKISMAYGSDTLLTFKCIRHSKKICVDNSILYHYLQHNSSTSYAWKTGRIDSDQILYKDAEDFLLKFGPISEQNREFINIVYANAISDTVNVLDNSQISSEEKLKELRRIAECPITKNAFMVSYPDVVRSKSNLLGLAFKCAIKSKSETEDFPAILSSLLPGCSNAVSAANAGLFIAVPDLRKPLVDDDKGGLLKELLKLISENRYVKQYNIPEMVHKLSAGNQLLSFISDSKFLRKHSDIYLMVWNNEFLNALTKMTEQLLGGARESEDYLQLYLSLSALLERADEFVFGKTKIAEFYFSKKRYDECRTAIADLSDMCVEDTPEIARIKEQLNIR